MENRYERAIDNFEVDFLFGRGRYQKRNRQNKKINYEGFKVYNNLYFTVSLLGGSNPNDLKQDDYEIINLLVEEYVSPFFRSI